jgi:hypothetical protein
MVSPMASCRNFSSINHNFLKENSLFNENSQGKYSKDHSNSNEMLKSPKIANFQQRSMKIDSFHGQFGNQDILLENH